jgi:hypothetical protein
MPSKTARKSGIKGPVVKDPFDTNEKKIHELRKQVASHLYVRPDFIVALLEEYDVLCLQLDGAKYKLKNQPAEGKSQLIIEQGTNVVDIVRPPSPSEKLQEDLEPIHNQEVHHIDPIFHQVGLIDHGGEGG